MHKELTVVGLCIGDDGEYGQVLSTVDDALHLLITFSVQLCRPLYNAMGDWA